MYQYNIFNLALQSELAFPHLPTGTDHHSISISFGSVNSEGITNPTLTGLYYQATPDTFWLHVPEIARFLISNGNTITIDAAENADEDSLRAFILDVCIGILLMQRKVFLLRAGVVKVKDHGIAFLGIPGMGISTLMAAFLNRGYTILTDKVCAIDNECRALPSSGHIELWQHVIDALGLDLQSLTRVRPTINKRIVPLGKQHHQASLPIKLMYTLQFNAQQPIQFTKLTGVKKIEHLQHYLYKNQFRTLLNGPECFKQCIAISNQIEMVCLERKAVEFPLDQLVQHIEQDWYARGIQ